MSDTFIPGDPVILIGDQHLRFGPKVMPKGCVGYAVGSNPDLDPPLTAVNFGAFGIIWCATEKLGHAVAEFVDAQWRRGHGDQPFVQVGEMIERVARALCTDREPDDVRGGFHPCGQQLDEGEAWWTGYCEQARAAILAMRNPTEAMVASAYVRDGGCGPDEVSRINWQLMIDAALK